MEQSGERNYPVFEIRQDQGHFLLWADGKIETQGVFDLDARLVNRLLPKLNVLRAMVIKSKNGTAPVDWSADLIQSWLDTL